MHGASRAARSTVYGSASVAAPEVDPDLESDYWGLHPSPVATVPPIPAQRAPGERIPTQRGAGSGRTRPRRDVEPEAPESARRRTRRRDPLWARLCLVFGALLMMASGGVIVGSKVLIGQATSAIEQHDLVTGEAMAGSNIDGAINLLLVGIDVGGKRDGAKLGARSDTIVIAHIPASHDQAYLVSLPRDTRVQIPALPEIGFGGSTEKINASFEYGYKGPGTEIEKRARGVKLLANTINKLTGIKFNGAAIIDFEGFEAVLRELGGVDMCVDQRAESIHLARDIKTGAIIKGPVWYDDDAGVVRGVPKGAEVVVHQPGCRRMSPELALDYSRIRKNLNFGDYDRQRHQQQLIKAIAKEATSKGVLTDFGKLKRVMEAAGKAFVLDTNKVPIEDFLFTLKGVAANDLALVKVNKGVWNNETIDGISYQKLSDESMDMLHAVRDGKLYEFLVTHPDFLSIG